MKPEASSEKLKVESEKEEVEHQKEEDVEMTEDEKAVLNLLNVSTPIDLNALKEQTGLSV